MLRRLTRTLLAAALGLGVQGCDDDAAPGNTLDAGADTGSNPGFDGATLGDAGSDAAPSTVDGGADTGGAQGSDGAVQAVTFKVKLENVAPFTLLKSGSFNTAVGATQPGPLKPGEAYELTFTAGKGHKLSLASMFGASNDWFFGFDPGGLPLYAADGTPVSGDVTSQLWLWNAGTEVDEEPGVGPHTGPKQAMSADGPGAADPDSKVRKIPAIVTLANGSPFNVPSVGSMVKVTITPNPATREFKVRIENVSNDASTLMTSQGPLPVRISPAVWALTMSGEPLFSEGMPDRGKGLENIAESGDIGSLSSALPALTGLATGISPGVWVLHATGSPIFSAGQPDRAQGLENIAESGNISPLSMAFGTSPPSGASAQGLFNMPIGKTMPGPGAPGDAYEFSVTARPGDHLSFVTMFGWSNDWFFGTPDTGIALFDASGQPASGDVTATMKLYDAGTELSEEPAVGPNTGPQQSSPTAGPPDTDTKVREVATATYATPVTKHIKVSITH